MSFKGLFICVRFVEFTSESGEVIRGYVPYVLDVERNEIVKCRMQKNSMTEYKFGDEVDVVLNIRGNYVRYEVI